MLDLKNKMENKIRSILPKTSLSPCFPSFTASKENVNTGREISVYQRKENESPT